MNDTTSNLAKTIVSISVEMTSDVAPAIVCLLDQDDLHHGTSEYIELNNPMYIYPDQNSGFEMSSFLPHMKSGVVRVKRAKVFATGVPDDAVKGVYMDNLGTHQESIFEYDTTAIPDEEMM